LIISEGWIETMPRLIHRRAPPPTLPMTGTITSITSASA
jgi:hypothetical protein